METEYTIKMDETITLCKCFGMFNLTLVIGALLDMYPDREFSVWWQTGDQLFMKVYK